MLTCRVPACEEAAIQKITPHGLRHTGNDLLRRFASREVVMAITGHSHYSHVDQGEKADAVGKVIDLVTKPANREAEERKRGVIRGVEADRPDRALDAETKNPALLRGSAGGATQI